MKAKRVALVHDWLTGMRCGETVLEAALELSPQAEIYTLLHAGCSPERLIAELSELYGWA